MKISIIIVTYNSSTVITSCLNSLLKLTSSDVEIIVVDNKSHDATLDILKSFADKIIIIANNNNLGYGAAANLGFHRCHGELLYFLNPDTVINDHQALNKIQQFMHENRHYGMAGTQCISAKRSFEKNIVYDYPNQHLLKHKLAALPGDVAWIFGASMIVCRDVFEKINGFDEDYFVYAEDTDIGMRVRKAGYSIGVIKNVSIEHVGGSSETVSSPYAFIQRRLQSTFLFYQKHYHPDDMRRIIQQLYKQARRHMLWHRIRKFFVNTKRIRYRYEKYHAIYQISRNFLLNQEPI